jgi:adenylate cyclase
MKPESKLKIQNILAIIGIALFFGLLYNFFFYPHTLSEFLEAGSISILLGLIIGILEEFVLKRTFQKMSSFTVTIIRTTIYSLFISIILCLVLSIENSFVQLIGYSEAVNQYLFSSLFVRDFLFSLIFIIIILFTSQVMQLTGKVNFFKLMLGFYHRPREVSRIFMFLDLKDSTSIAEKLGNKRYSALIKDFFFDISEAIILFNGEIYQYAGDEIIVTWPLKGDNINCIKTFFKMEEIIKKKSKTYSEKYNLLPKFKAGIHCGRVMVTTVGRQKKEIAYHGDVLNTTARIEGKCNELEQRLLISKNILPFIKNNNKFVLKEKGEIELKGKSDKLSLYGVKLA